MSQHVRPSTKITGGTTLHFPDGQKINADAVPMMLRALTEGIHARTEQRRADFIRKARAAIEEAMKPPEGGFAS